MRCKLSLRELVFCGIGSDEPVDGVGDFVVLHSPPLVALHGYHHGYFAVGGELDDVHAVIALGKDIDADVVRGGVPACDLETGEVVVLAVVGVDGVVHLADSVLAAALTPDGVANLDLDVEGAAQGTYGAVLLAVDLVDVEHDVVEVEVGGGAEVLDEVALGGGRQELDVVDAADEVGVVALGVAVAVEGYVLVAVDGEELAGIEVDLGGVFGADLLTVTNPPGDALGSGETTGVDGAVAVEVQVVGLVGPLKLVEDGIPVVVQGIDLAIL